MSLHLLTLFGKNDQSDLSAAERNELGALVELLIEESGLWAKHLRVFNVA